MTTTETKRKGKQAEFTYCGDKFPGVCYITTKAGKIYYAKYTSPDGVQHKEKIGASSEGWTPAKVRDERADRKRGKAPTNLEQRASAKAAAEAKARAIEENLVTDSTTFEKYATDWLDRKKSTLKQSTWRDYRSAFNKHVLPALGKIPFTKVTFKAVEDFVGKLDGVGGKRINNIMVPVKCLFNDAKRRGDLAENPTEAIRRMREERVEIDPLSFQEMKAFLDAVDPRYRSYFATAFLTGMRPNELIALKWIHVDFDLRIISVREGRVQGIEGPPKTDSSYRDVDVLAPLFEILRQHRMASPAEATYVFTNSHGNPLEVNNLRNKVWYPALEKAGLRRRTMYQTRHTFASLMLAAGEDPVWVARMLGHSTLAMLFRNYAKWIRNRSRRDGMKFVAGFDEVNAPTKAIAAPNEEVS